MRSTLARGRDPSVTGASTFLQRLRASLPGIDLEALIQRPFIAIHGEPGIGKTRLLRELARTRPRVVESLDEVVPGSTVILDDFDDGPDHERLAQLLRRPPRGVTIAIAYRRLPPALTGALEAAARRGILTDVALQPLTPAEADALLGRPAGALYRLAGGNPFYLLELARGSENRPPGDRRRDRPGARRAQPDPPASSRSAPPSRASSHSPRSRPKARWTRWTSSSDCSRRSPASSCSATRSCGARSTNSAARAGG